MNAQTEIDLEASFSIAVSNLSSHVKRCGTKCGHRHAVLILSILNK
jgi:hypothetical protein